MPPWHAVLAALSLAMAWPMPAPPQPPLPGTFVRFTEKDQCPSLSPRSPPNSVRDLRPDDFRVVMALGDSITAGLLAKNKREESIHSSGDSQVVFNRLLSTNPFTLEEYRGVSYAMGGDPDAVTLPNLFGHYTHLTGQSTGHHPPVSCFGPICPHPESDGLNAAISGSTSANLASQVWNYLVPAYKALDEDGWAYVNVGIGANDICAFCLAPNASIAPGSPEEYAAGIKHAVNHLRMHVPRMLINIVGLFRVSAVYKLTLKDPYCQGPLVPPGVPHLPLECSCALLPGPAGDFTRAKMDDLSDEYDRAVVNLVREWEKENDPNFAAIWQPGVAVDLPNYPITALSPVDCFHPSEAAHQRVAAGIWNRMTLNMTEKAIPIRWEDDIWVRCLEEDDRIHVRLP